MQAQTIRGVGRFDSVDALRAVGFFGVGMTEMRDGFGTRHIWLPFDKEGSVPEITADSGYVDVVLLGVHCRADGPLWTRRLASTEELLVTSTLTWHSKTRGGTDPATMMRARAVHEPLRPNAPYRSMHRVLALEIPARVAQIDLSVELSSVHRQGTDDLLELLGAYQRPLQIGSAARGATHVLNQMIDDMCNAQSTPHRLTAAWSATIADAPSSQPAEQGRLREGYLVLLSCSDSDPQTLLDLGGEDLSVDGARGRLEFRGRPFEGSYIMLAIHRRPRRGVDEAAEWWRAFSRAQEALVSASSEPSWSLSEVLLAYQQGVGLLRADLCYLSREKEAIESECTARLLSAWQALRASQLGDLRQKLMLT